MTQREVLTIGAVLLAVYLAINFLLPDPVTANEADAVPPDDGGGGGSILDSVTDTVTAIFSGNSMQLDDAGENFIKVREGLPGGAPALVGYADSKGVPTDGWGNTRGAVVGQAITADQAEADFQSNTAWAVAAVNRLVKVPLSQGQFNVLVSFTFNVGAGQKGLAGSTLLSLLNAGNYDAVPAQLMRWVNSGGRPILTSRRQLEVSYWQQSPSLAPVLELASNGGDGSDSEDA